MGRRLSSRSAQTRALAHRESLQLCRRISHPTTTHVTVKTVAEIENPEVQEFAQRAIAFVRGFRWCRDVTACTLGFAVAGVLGIFRVDLVPGEGADPTVWVIVGDLPPAYIAFEPDDSWQDALRGYVEETRLWTEAAATGGDVSELIPVNVPPTPEYAAMLSGRLDFLERHLLDADPESLEGDA